MSKIKITGICLIALAISFALGRRSVSNPEVQTTISVKENVKKEIDKDTKKNTTTTIVELPDGSKKTTIITTEETNSHSDSTRVVKGNENQTVTPEKTGTLNVSLLVTASSFTEIHPIYGLSVSKEVLGPITVGAFGLMNGTAGVSFGVNF